MQISAIGSINNFSNKAILNGQYNKAVSFSGTEEEGDTIDFNAMADAVNQDQPEDRKASPTKFFLTSCFLTAASFIAARKVSSVAIDKIANKLGLSKSMGNLGKSLSSGLEKLKARKAIEVTGVKTFFINNTNRTLSWLGHSIEKLGKRGIKAEEMDAFKKLMGKEIPEGALYAQNALKTTVASVLGLGSAGLTVASRYKDDNGNGIPDRAEKALGRLNQTAELLKTVASVCDAAA